MRSGQVRNLASEELCLFQEGASRLEGSLVKWALTLNKGLYNDMHLAQWEREVDEIVYRPYGLSEQETKGIDG